MVVRSARLRASLLLWLPGLLGVLALCVLAYVMDFDRAKWVEQVVISLVSGITATFLALLLGLKQIEKIVENNARRSAFREVVSFWQTGSSSRRFVVLFGGSRRTEGADIEIRLQFATAYSFATVAGVLHQLFDGGARIDFLPARTYSPAELSRLVETDNVIILGGDISVPFTAQVLETIQAPYRQNCSGECREVNRLEGNRVCEAHHSVVENSDIVRDVALVTRIVHPRTRNLLVFISGNYGVGTIGGALAVTTPALFPSAGFDPQASGQQCVIAVSGVQAENVIYRDKAVVTGSKWVACDASRLDEAVRR